MGQRTLEQHPLHSLDDYMDTTKLSNYLTTNSDIATTAVAQNIQSVRASSSSNLCGSRSVSERIRCSSHTSVVCTYRHHSLLLPFDASTVSCCYYRCHKKPRLFVSIRRRKQVSTRPRRLFIISTSSIIYSSLQQVQNTMLSSTVFISILYNQY